VPTLLLDHRGRKSGTVFVTPLLYPQWYRNLVANPDAYAGSDRPAVHAVIAGPDERARLWPKLVELYADFDNYQNWTGREIPVVVLQPR